MAKTAPIEVVVKVVRCEEGGVWTMSDAEFKRELEQAKSEAWLEGMNHALSWLALRQFSGTMAKDNPYGRES